MERTPREVTSEYGEIRTIFIPATIPEELPKLTLP
jgi:hypothetical protein